MTSLKDLKTYLAGALICLALTSSPVISFADDSQVWSDPKTGLTWSKCPVGKHYGPDSRNEIGCVSDGESKFNWWAAVVAADQSELAGFSDWRMPTFEELKTLLSCDYAPDSMFLPLLHDKARMNSPEAKDLIPGCVMNEHAAINFNKVVGTESPWTATIYVDMFSKVANPNKVRLWDNQSWNTKSFPGANKTDRNEVALVRGGTPSETYATMLAESQKESARLLTPTEN